MARLAPAPTWALHHVRSPTGPGRVEVMTAGRGDPLVFLHGWGLTPRSYLRAVVRLCGAGVRVIAPPCPASAAATAYRCAR